MAKRAVKVIGLDKLAIRIKRLANSVRSEQLMEDVGARASAMIKLRTSKGTDVDGNQFSPYSAAYALLRAKKDLPIDPPDLFFTGSMLSAMTYEAEPHEVRLHFLSTADMDGVENDKKAMWNDESRYFFDLNDDELDILTEEISDFLDNAFERA